MKRTYSGVPGDSRCECSDPGCPVHEGKSSCDQKATHLLYRVDMEDQTGTAFCAGCGEDAFDSGLFTDETEDLEAGL